MDIALISAPTGKVLQQPSKRNQQARENRAILQPLEVEHSTGRGAVKLILSWHGLPVETKIMVIRHFHDL